MQIHSLSCYLITYVHYNYCRRQENSVITDASEQTVLQLIKSLLSSTVTVVFTSAGVTFALQQAVSVYAVGQLTPCRTVQASVPASWHILVNQLQCTKKQAMRSSNLSLRQSTRHKTCSQLVTYRYFETVNSSPCDELTGSHNIDVLVDDAITSR